MKSHKAAGANSQGLLDYQIQGDPERSGVTSFSGLALVADPYQARADAVEARVHTRDRQR